jgi:hypothetical protein
VNPVKQVCIHCGQAFETDAGSSAGTVACPNCGKSTPIGPSAGFRIKGRDVLIILVVLALLAALTLLFLKPKQPARDLVFGDLGGRPTPTNSAATNSEPALPSDNNTNTSAPPASASQSNTIDTNGSYVGTSTNPASASPPITNLPASPPESAGAPASTPSPAPPVVQTSPAPAPSPHRRSVESFESPPVEPEFTNSQRTDELLKAAKDSLSATSNKTPARTAELLGTGKDIGSSTPNATVAPPQIQVFNGTNPITNAQKNTVKFGSVAPNLAGTIVTFIVTNTGGQPLEIKTVFVPQGYILTQNPPFAIGAGMDGVFGVQLDSSTIGIHSGNIIIANNDPSNGLFSFPITGMVTSGPAEVPGPVPILRTPALLTTNSAARSSAPGGTAP